MRMTRIVMMVFLLVGLTGCVAPPPAQVLHAPQDFIEHGFDEREWKVAYQAGNEKRFLSEWVMNNESLEDWSELLVAQTQYGDLAVKTLKAAFEKRLAEACPSMRSITVSEDESSILWIWMHDGCHGQPAQREVRKFMKGSDGLYSLAYSVKETSFSKENYATWIKIISAAKLHQGR